MKPEDQAKIRLRTYVAHFADHAEDHLAEIGALKPSFVDDALLTQLIQQAIDDMEIARRSLRAVLDALGSCPTAGHPQHAH